MPVENAVERDMPFSVLSSSEMGGSYSGSASMAFEYHETRAPVTESVSKRNQLTHVMPNVVVDIPRKGKIGLSGSDESGVVSSEPPVSCQAGAKSTGDDWQGVEFHSTGNQAEASTSADSEDAVHKLVYPADNLAITQNSHPLQIRFGSIDVVNETSSGSLAVENSDAELSGSNLVDEISKGSLADENGDPELDGAVSSVGNRSTQGCNMVHLEQIIEDAKSNKVCQCIFWTFFHFQEIINFGVMCSIGGFLYRYLSIIFFFIFCDDVENLVHCDGVDYESDERS